MPFNPARIDLTVAQNGHTHFRNPWLERGAHRDHGG